MASSLTHNAELSILGRFLTTLANSELSASWEGSIMLMEEYIFMLSSCLSLDSEHLTLESSMLTDTIRTYALATAIQPMDGIMRQRMAMWSQEDWLDPRMIMFRTIRSGLVSCLHRIKMNFGNLCEAWIRERFASTLPLCQPTPITVMLLRELNTGPQMEWDSMCQVYQRSLNGWQTNLESAVTAGEFLIFCGCWRSAP